ncbi:hypothetical protein [Mycobacteroides abscessus]|uniref:hypothetical protein n=3 Tax=Mycobacteroides abscessus TaxID=36809 RepID=UPI00092A1970|nr:hypothetical protein [Mycobacteroides abscessus]MBN7329821.1 hypothetical protein [Mycobacteroides abscessus subsp. abscessus]SIF22412.1 Protein of uncharacterised function (DUF2637) [Mycobacteroides abscessus subsp. abscessus]SIG35261.1 Protein of uncharacterised function (DUF2637) [Mycobacteroides abscessus subsp. abscessus]SIG51943.1 Protein of uncharacterised function (DUF2637) [Mycobacteroides abscessus subsp. abscessus]
MSSVVPTRAARWYWALCAVVGGVLTVLVNVAHGLGKVPAPHTVPAGLVSAVPPLMTIALFEGYFIAKRCAPQRVLRVVMGAVIVLGGAAFSISYTSIAMFLNRQSGDLPEWTGWVMPALLDIFVMVSAYVLYVLSQHAAQIPQTSTAPSTSSRWRRLADAATARAEAALAAPTSLQAETLVEVHGGSAESAVDVPVGSVASSAEPATTPAVEVRKPAAKPSVKSLVEPELEPFMEAAQRMVEQGVVTRKSAVEIARVIAAVEEGKSDNAIKNSGLASASTASKVRMARLAEAGRVLTAV